MKKIITYLLAIFCANTTFGSANEHFAINYRNIESIVITGKVNVNVEQNTGNSIDDKLHQSNHVAPEISTIIEDKTLYLRSISEDLIPLNINVGDKLRNIEISKGGLCNIQNIHCSDNITLTVKDESRVNATLNCKKLRVKANKDSRVKIKGTCEILLSAESKRRSIIDISELKCEVVRDIIAYGKSTIKLNAAKIGAVSRHPKSIIIINNKKL